MVPVDRLLGTPVGLSFCAGAAHSKQHTLMVSLFLVFSHLAHSPHTDLAHCSPHSEHRSLMKKFVITVAFPPPPPLPFLFPPPPS